MTDKTSEWSIRTGSVAGRLWQEIRHARNRSALLQRIENGGLRWDTLYRKLVGRRRLTADECATIGILLRLEGNWILYGFPLRQNTIRPQPDHASAVAKRLRDEVNRRTDLQRKALTRGVEARHFKPDTLQRKLRGKRRLTAGECAVLAGLLHLDGNWVLYGIGPRRTPVVTLYLSLVFDEPGEGAQTQQPRREVQALGPGVIGVEQWAREEAIRRASPDPILHPSLGPNHRTVTCRFCNGEFRQDFGAATDLNGWGPPCCPDCFDERVTIPRRVEELGRRRHEGSR